ncbi:hypothetical protein PWR63_04465 [Paraburkholderia sp. A2WS-5]|uniref:hypothetical protein n=1 Tax=Paraburkholderia sp. A2WS-5 TaxID=3028372 RepID=UPI003B80B1CC
MRAVPRKPGCYHTRKAEKATPQYPAAGKVFFTILFYLNLIHETIGGIKNGWCRKSRRRLQSSHLLALGSLTLAATFPYSGLGSAAIGRAGTATGAHGIQIVDVTEQLIWELSSERKKCDFSGTLGNEVDFQQQLDIGELPDGYRTQINRA